MSEQTENVGLNSYHELQAKAKSLGLKASGTTEDLEKAIAAKEADPLATPVEDGVLTKAEAGKIEARLKLEFDYQDKIRAERKIKTDLAEITAESESLNIPIDLPEHPTELDLAKARRALGIKKKEVKPSPETVKIEASKRGYYVFTNLEQEDAAHTVGPGGKYFIHLIPDQIHVLSDWHIKFFRQKAVMPVYGKIPTGVVAGPGTEGQLAEKCAKTGTKPRFAFERLGDAPQEAPFGMVTDTEVLAQFKLENEEALI